MLGPTLQRTTSEGAMAVTDLDAKLLVEAHKEGRNDAFDVIVRAHRGSLLAHAYAKLHDGAAAEDAVQETFLRAYRAMPRFGGEFRLGAWLHRILANVCHDEGARRQRDRLLVDRASWQAQPPAEAADVCLDRLDGTVDVAAALAALPPSYQEALVLRYVDDLSYEEVAAATGVTEGNARVRVMRGRAALKRAVASSHALVVAMAPFLRRGGRGPDVATDVPGLVASASASATTPNLLASAPLLLRATDAAPQLADRVASIPQILGVVATLAVPFAAPVVGEQVAGWVNPPPAVAPPLPEAAAAPPPTLVAPPPTAGRLSAPATGFGGAARTSSDVTTSPAGADVPVTAATPTTVPSVASTTSLPGVSGTTAPPTTVTAPTRRPSSGATPAVVAPEPLAPSRAAFVFALRADRIAVVGDLHRELSGPVTWGTGTESVAGELRGTLTFQGAPAGSSGAAPVGEAAPSPAGSTDVVVEGVGDHTATTGTTTAPLPPPLQRAPQGFTAELTLDLADGRTYRLSLVDGALDPLTTGTAMTSSFDLRDRCGTLVATGTVSGDLALGMSPAPSSLALTLDGEGPAEALACG